MPALLTGVFHQEVGRNEGKDALGIPHWNETIESTLATLGVPPSGHHPQKRSSKKDT